MTGPVKEIIVATAPANLATDTGVKFGPDDVIEEGIVWPVEEEVTENDIRGVPQQTGVRVKFTLPVRLASGKTQSMGSMWPPYWIKIKVEGGGQPLILGGIVGDGLSLRRVMSANLAFGKQAVVLFHFEGTFSQHGVGLKQQV